MAGNLKRVKLPKDEVAERQQREVAARFTEIAKQQLEWAHRRTEDAMDRDAHDAADEHAHTTYMWMDKLTGS